MSLYNINDDNGIREKLEKSNFYDPSRTSPFSDFNVKPAINIYKNKLNNYFYRFYISLYHIYYTKYLQHKSDVKENFFLEYFKFLHIENIPNLYEYEILVKKFGVPDILNPYEEYVIEYSYYGQPHILGREFENVLHYMMFKEIFIEQEKEIEKMTLFEYCDKTLCNQLKNSSIDLKVKKTNYTNSLYILAITLQYVNSIEELENLFDLVNMNNIRNVVREILFNVDPTFYPIDLDKIQNNLIKLNIYKEEEIDFLNKIKLNNKIDN